MQEWLALQEPHLPAYLWGACLLMGLWDERCGPAV